MRFMHFKKSETCTFIDWINKRDPFWMMSGPSRIQGHEGSILDGLRKRRKEHRLLHRGIQMKEFINTTLDIKGLQDAGKALPDSLRFPARPATEGEDWTREKRRQALTLLVSSCELWREADQVGLRAVQTKLETVIMHAHDAFVQMKQPDRTEKLSQDNQEQAE
jgi:hypothetical protein